MARTAVTRTGKLHSLGEFRPSSRQAWRAWLQKHHTSSPGIWLVYAKKHTGIPSLTYNDAVEEALCFGWIDSLLHPVDDSFFKQVFTPRKPTSGWSALNRTRVARLIKAGLMTEAGKRMVTLAKKTGTWEALASIDALELPADLKKAMDAKPTSKRTWATYSPAARKMLLYYLNDAKRPETRAKRIADIVGFVARNGSLADLRAGKIKL